MTQHIDPCNTARNHVLAAALALQQCTKTAANIVPIPGTGRFITIGTRAEVVRLLELDTAAAPPSTGDGDLPALPHTTYNGYSDGSEPLWTREQMHDYARAARTHGATPAADQQADSEGGHHD